MANTLAYYDTATITAVKSFIVQAPGHKAIYILDINLLTLFVSYTISSLNTIFHCTKIVELTKSVQIDYKVSLKDWLLGLISQTLLV